VAAAAACTRTVDRENPATDADAASLSIEFSAANLGIDVATRTSGLPGLDDPDNPEGMTDEAALVDGSKMQRLIVFLINKKENRIVAYRDIQHGSTDLGERNGFLDETGAVNHDLVYASRALVTFDYDNPKHVDDNGNSAERFLRGEYRVFAVANYDHDILTSDDNTNIRETLESIVTKFNADPANGIGNFNPDYEPFYNIRFLLRRDDANDPATQPYMRPAVRNTLSVTQTVHVVAGSNYIKANLLRISARVRVEVKNYSPYPLQINSLALSDNFTMSTTYLFRRDDNADNYVIADLHDGKGAPVVEHSNAIVSFEPGTKVATNEKKGVFDALLYESCDEENPYTYTIDVSYPDVTNYQTDDPTKLDASRPIEEITVEMGYRHSYAMENNGYIIPASEEDAAAQIGAYDCFLLQGIGSKKYLYENADGSLKAGGTKIDLASEDIEQYLWVLKSISNDSANADGSESPDANKHSFTLQNLATQKYIPVLTAGEGLTSTDQTSAGQFKIGIKDKNITFKNGNLYISVWAAGTNLGGYNQDDEGCQYRLYPIKREKISAKEYVGTPRFNQPVKLTTFNDETAVVEDVHEIRRNDFVRILVEVSYNPDKCDFEFKVTPWDKDKGGDVTFN